MPNLHIKHKLILGLLVPLVLLALSSAVAMIMMGQIRDGVTSIYNDRVIPLEDLKIIADDYAVLVIDAINKTNVGGFSAERAGQELVTAKKEIAALWQKYLATTLTPEEAQLAREADALFVPANATIDQLASKLSTRQGDIRGQLTDDIMPLYQVIDPISGKIAELITLQLKVAGQEKIQVDTIHASSQSLFISITLVALATCIIIGLWINRSVMLPIATIMDNLHRMRKHSDLTVRCSSLNQDELGQIADNLTQVTEHLHGIMCNIADTSITVSSAVQEQSDFIHRTSEHMQQQQAETEQTATAMNQMTATVSEVAQSTTAAADFAQQANAQAAEGNAIVQQSMLSMSRLSEQIQTTAEVITSLAQDSQQIGQVLDVIKSIAEQTNLLALNAAIEAARAGEQGRGFAVVADEVRTLAKRTHDSTQEIETMMSGLQNGVQQAVTAMNAGLSQVQDANTKATQAGQALQRIVSSVDQISNLNTHIATAAEEQSSVAESINRSIIAISDITRESTRSAEALNQSMQKLGNMAIHMQNAISTFKL